MPIMLRVRSCTYGAITMSLHRWVVDRAAYTVDEFCEAYRISRSQLYKLWRQGKGPRWMGVDGRRRITTEAARDWCHASEVEATA
jgi:hypothetical protein